MVQKGQEHITGLFLATGSWIPWAFNACRYYGGSWGLPRGKTSYMVDAHHTSARTKGCWALLLLSRSNREVTKISFCPRVGSQKETKENFRKMNSKSRHQSYWSHHKEIKEKEFAHDPESALQTTHVLIFSRLFREAIINIQEFTTITIPSFCLRSSSGINFSILQPALPATKPNFLHLNSTAIKSSICLIRSVLD